jgi:hypothetical protein
MPYITDAPSFPEIVVTPAFVAALADEYAKKGRAALDRLRNEDPARFLMVVLTVATDERYVEAWHEADKLAAQ